MDKAKELEFEYGKRLRESSALERKVLYAEAYSVVSDLAKQRFTSTDPECRTAGTSKRLVQVLSQIVKQDETILEIGSGRGYTCLMLAPFVKSITGIEVSDPSIAEAKELISGNGISNAALKHISAFELTDHFRASEFNVCISIDVVEHLHPEDALEHFNQVHTVLKPGGKYIIIMPNRLDSPHDITREEYPGSKTALGFHLNESTYREIIKDLKNSGFKKFQTLLYRYSKKEIKALLLPGVFGKLFEFMYRIIPGSFRIGIVRKLIGIRLLAYKPMR